AVQRFRYVTLPGLKYVVMVVLLLSFISTSNQFGLIYLMTSGGPSGATKLYSILAYEKSIGSPQYAPASAIALSVAPLTAMPSALLARFLRQDDREAKSNGGRFGIGRMIGAFFGRLFSLFLDIIMLPFDLALRGIEALAKRLRQLLKGDPYAPLMKLESRENTNIGLRLLLLVPIMAFVLFPFYWVLVTSFKTDAQISTRESIFWPDPVTVEQFTSLINQTSFLLWLGNSVLVALVSTVV